MARLNDILPPELQEQRRLMFRVCPDKEALRDWLYLFLDLEFPLEPIDPDSNCTPLDMVWDSYRHFTQPATDVVDVDSITTQFLYYASRNGGKTLAESVIEVLAMLHMDIDVVHLAAIEEQSGNAQRYLKNFFGTPALRGLLCGNNIRTTEVEYFRHPSGVVLYGKEFKALDEPDKAEYKRVYHKTEVVVATMASVNGKHVPLVCGDEIELMHPHILEESKNILTPKRLGKRRSILPIYIMTSTRKFAGGIVQKIIDKADENHVAVKHWNILDVSHACPPEKHRPDLPRLPIYRDPDRLLAVDEDTFNALPDKEKGAFVKDEGWNGCLTNCKRFAECRGILATQKSEAEFLQDLNHTLTQIRNNNPDIRKSQLLCWKPSATGVIYPSLNRHKHLITPAQAYEKVFGKMPEVGENMTKEQLYVEFAKLDGRWLAGQDYGDTHAFACVNGWHFGSRYFITQAFSQSEIDVPEQIELCRPILRFTPAVYGDPAQPGTIRMFRKAGFSMREWTKYAGSVSDGIQSVRALLSPTDSEPLLYFVKEPTGDPMMELLVQHLEEYRWALDAAKQITDKPHKENDHLPDALRYVVLNNFNTKGKVVVGTTKQAAAPAEVKPTMRPPEGAGQQDFMLQLIREHTGNPAAVAPKQDGNVQKVNGVYKKGRLHFSVR